MQRNFKKLFFFGILTLLIMVLIFVMSAQDVAKSQSLSMWLFQTAFGQWLTRFLPKLTDMEGDHDLRKYAHMGEYMLLLLSSCGFFRELFLEQRPLKTLVAGAGFCFVYACTDEWHQLYVSGRAGQFSDVMIDMVGVAVGLLLFFVYCLLRRERE